MTVAALVAGNTVVLKPSERAPMMAWQLAEALREAGLPDGVLTVLPGFGDVGQALVEDPRVDLIAFTGSREVGLAINRRAADPAAGQDHVKRVIAEMGGKNAIIVDDDADLDEAVVGVLQSAFGYAGQKCSACSRVIVLDRIHDAFLSRLVEAARALSVGPAEDPDTVVGPVIDARARQRIEEYVRIGATEGRVVLATDVGPLADRGNYVGPHIIAGVRPDARIAQEEIFGPVLAVLRAADLDEALAIANGTVYALTGGLYSRSPANIERIKREFRVGNLYINRPITGALVDRQPFGGFKLSGIGTKAGGPDYLNEFLLTRTVTENTMRRGFAPIRKMQRSVFDRPVQGRPNPFDCRSCVYQRPFAHSARAYRSPGARLKREAVSRARSSHPARRSESGGRGVATRRSGRGWGPRSPRSRGSASAFLRAGNWPGRRIRRSR